MSHKEVLLPGDDIETTSRQYQRLIAKVAGEPEERMLELSDAAIVEEVARYSNENRGQLAFITARAIQFHLSHPPLSRPDSPPHSERFLLVSKRALARRGRHHTVRRRLLVHRAPGRGSGARTHRVEEGALYGEPSVRNSTLSSSACKNSGSSSSSPSYSSKNCAYRDYARRAFHFTTPRVRLSGQEAGKHIRSAIRCGCNWPTTLSNVSCNLPLSTLRVRNRVEEAKCKRFPLANRRVYHLFIPNLAAWPGRQLRRGMGNAFVCLFFGLSQPSH